MFEAFDKHEVDDGSEGKTAENSDFPLQRRILVRESEDDTGKILNECSEKERYRDGDENRHYDCQRLAGVHQIADRQVGIARGFHQCYRYGSSKQLEYHGYGSGGRQSQGVENIQQDDVGGHDSQ